MTPEKLRERRRAKEQEKKYAATLAVVWHDIEAAHVDAWSIAFIFALVAIICGGAYAIFH